MPYRYPIYRANEANLRKQIMEALEGISRWPSIQTSVGQGDYVVVPEDSQMIVYEAFYVDGGWLELDGQLVVLGGAYRDEASGPATGLWA